MCPVPLNRYSPIKWPSAGLTYPSLSTKLTGDKKQHEMRLRLKADRDEAKEARSSNTIAISAKSPKPIVSKETSAVKKIKKIKPPKKDFAKKEPMQDFASALMKLGEICSQEMEQLKSGDSQRSSDSDNEASQSSETSNYVSNNENETCASSILAMMSHRKRNGSSKAKMQQEEKASQDCSPRPSFELSKSDGESCHAQLPRGFDPEKQMEFMSNSKISVAQQAELGTLKASIHQAIRDDAMMLAEQSRAVTPPSLDDKQLQSGWTYYPLAIPNYALQGGGAWKLRLVPANGQTGGSIVFDPRTGFPGTAGNASNMQTYHV